MQRRIEKVWYHSRGVLLPTTAVILLGLLWEGSVHYFSIPVYLFPAPSVIWIDFISKADLVFGHTLATVSTIMGGFVLSIVISLQLAMMIAS